MTFYDELTLKKNKTNTKPFSNRQSAESLFDIQTIQMLILRKIIHLIHYPCDVPLGDFTDKKYSELHFAMPFGLSFRFKCVFLFERKTVPQIHKSFIE